MGSNAGSGYPIAFVCWKCRQDKRGPFPKDPGKHHQRRTGETKPIRRGKYGTGIRCLTESHEYVCTCGHTGWSKHRGVLARPLLSESPLPNPPKNDLL